MHGFTLVLEEDLLAIRKVTGMKTGKYITLFRNQRWGWAWLKRSNGESLLQYTAFYGTDATWQSVYHICCYIMHIGNKGIKIWIIYIYIYRCLMLHLCYNKHKILIILIVEFKYISHPWYKVWPT